VGGETERGIPERARENKADAGPLGVAKGYRPRHKFSLWRPHGTRLLLDPCVMPLPGTDSSYAVRAGHQSSWENVHGEIASETKQASQQGSRIVIRIRQVGQQVVIIT